MRNLINLSFISAIISLFPSIRAATNASVRKNATATHKREFLKALSSPHQINYDLGNISISISDFPPRKLFSIS